MNKLEVGKPAPKSLGLDQNGKEIKLEQYAGKKLIVYFYPHDNTPTCTTQSCNLRDNYDSLKMEGYEVIGVSADSAKKHQNFIKKFNLPFDLIADTEHKLLKSFGVWGEKTTFGKTYEGIHRTTFVIDEKGTVVNRIDKVKAKDHAQQIMAELKGE